MLQAWHRMWGTEHRMQPAFLSGWRAQRGAPLGKGWQELCAVPTPGCDPLTACVPGWPQQGLPLSPEDLLPFNPLFQDEILIAGASVQPGHHSEGMRGEEAECWPLLSPALATSVLSLPLMPRPTHPTLPCPVLSSGKNIRVHIHVLCQPRGRARGFHLCRSRGFGSAGSCPGAGRAQSRCIPHIYSSGCWKTFPGPSRLPECFSQAPGALPPVSWRIEGLGE